MEQKRLGDIATYINGFAFKPEDRGTYGLPIIRIQDLTGNSYDLGFYNGEYPERIEINDGDVLISWSASLGVYIWKRGKALLNQHIFKVAFDKCEINKQYFVYAVQHKLKEMESKTHGATMKHIVKKDFDNTTIPFPSLEKQAEIAEVLDRVSSIIAARQQELQKLDDLIKARFVEMFGNENTRTSLMDLCKFINGDRGKNYPSGNDIVASGVPFINAGHLEQNKISFANMNFLTEEKFNSLNSGKIQKNDILYCLRGSLGKKAIVEIEKGAIASSLLILRPNAEKIIPTFLLFTLEQPYIIEQMIKANNGSSQPNLSAQSVKDYQVILPSIDRQYTFDTFVKQIDKSKFVKPLQLLYNL